MLLSRSVSILLAVLWTAFIIYGLTASPSGIPTFTWLAKPGADKLVHAVLFGVEAGLLALAFGIQQSRRFWLPILIWCFALGGALELVQHYFIADRSGDVMDLIANMVGGILAMGIIQLIRTRIVQ